VSGVTQVGREEDSRAGPQPEAAHAYNNMGLLRICLALLVIVSHSFELTGGRRSELLVRVFGTMTFGEVAVDGFFLASGYLITKSYMNSRSIGAYLRRRVLRIYPGFIVATCFCLFVVAPLSGAPPIHFSVTEIIRQCYRVAILDYPEIDGAFRGVLVPEINLSMWTISYEFRCYLLVVVVGLVGLLRWRYLLLFLVVVLAIMYVCGFRLSLEYHVEQVIGKPTNLLRLCFLFFSGSLFFLFDRDIPYDRRGAAICGVCLIVCLFVPRLAEVGFAVFGGYLLFWLAFTCRPTPYSCFDSHVDLSYGTYLYAYPVQNLLIYSHRSISPWSVLVMGAPIAMGFAFASWWLVERPFMRLKQKVAV
jgi:peptidoglycan/LPS O-acetylase OafA/YrhL